MIFGDLKIVTSFDLAGFGPIQPMPLTYRWTIL